MIPGIFPNWTCSQRFFFLVRIVFSYIITTVWSLTVFLALFTINILIGSQNLYIYFFSLLWVDLLVFSQPSQQVSPLCITSVSLCYGGRTAGYEWARSSTVGKPYFKFWSSLRYCFHMRIFNCLMWYNNQNN